MFETNRHYFDGLGCWTRGWIVLPLLQRAWTVV